MVAVDAGDARLTIGVMLDRLSPLVLDLITAPRGLDVHAHRVLITSPSDDVGFAAGDVVLAVGASGSGSGFDDLLAHAGRDRAALVIAKLAPERRADACATADRCGVALAASPGAADWGQVFTLLRTLIETPGHTTDMDRGPSDVFALANAIAAAVGGATTIEDRELRVIAYSNLDHPIDDVRRDSILGRSVPPYVMARDDMVALYRRMFADGPVAHLPASTNPHVRRRMGAAVRAGDEVIGTIWVVEGDVPFHPEAERALVGSTAHAALLLLQHQHAGDLARRRRAEAVRGALDGAAGSLFPLADGERLRVVALRTHERPGLDLASVLVRQRRLAEVASLQFELLDDRAAAVDLDGVVLVIVPESNSVTARRIRDVVTGVAQRAAHALKRDVFAGIGGAVDDVGGLAASRWEAEETLAALLADPGASPPSRVATITEMRSQVVMRHVRERLADDPRCATPHLGLLARHDAEHHTEHLATLGGYLDAFGDVSSAAARLDIHPNTMRYRLKRIDEIIDLDLSDPVTRFVLELQWRLQ